MEMETAGRSRIGSKEGVEDDISGIFFFYWGISNADSHLYTKRKSPEISYTLNPFFTTDS
jgi:hypothetical protein